MKRASSHLSAWALLVTSLAWGCAAPGPAPTPEIPTTEIEIRSPAEPLAVGVRLQRGSFVRSKSNPDAMLTRFGRVLDSARVFSSVAEAPASDATKPAWRLILTAADYGEPNAYTFELQALIVRGNDPIANYATKQSARQARGQLTIGPAELAQLAERAIRDLVSKIAADSERLATL